MCQRCNSDSILSVSAKCSDQCSLSYKEQEHNDYVPSDLGIGGGDYVEFKLCLNCGQVQGEFPKACDLTPEDLMA
jgi:hypothetical protein